MKQIVRAFAIGLLTAGAIIAGIYFFVEKDSTAKSAMTHDEMANKLKNQGFRVITEEEYISFKVQKDKQQAEENEKLKPEAKSPTKEQTKKAPEQKQDKNSSQSDKTFSIQIASGMKTSEISEMLADNGIIKNAKDFDDYLEKHDYSSKIQIGKHKLSSNMSEKEIAETLTK